jgi:hypothetical protein
MATTGPQKAASMGVAAPAASGSTAATPKPSKEAVKATFGAARGAEAASGAAEVEPDPEARHRANMVANTFANLELQSAQATLRQYATLYDAALVENKRLAATMKQREVDTMKLVDHLGRQLEEKERDLRDTSLKLERAQETFKAQHQQRLRDLDDDIGRRDDTIAALREDLVVARAKLDELAHYEEDKQQLVFRISRQQEVERDLVLAHEKELAKLKFGSLEEKVKLRAVEKAMTDKFDSEVNERALNLVDIKTQQIRESNIALTRHKAQLEREVGRLAATLHDTTEGMDAARREADLAKASHSEYAKQGTKLTQAARNASRRVRELETRCSDLTRQMNTQKLELAVTHDDEVGELKHELKHSREVSVALKSQLEEMRRLTAHVLRQRSTLEAFFHDALAYTQAQQGKSVDKIAQQAGAALTNVMAPRLAAGFRGDLDARSNVADRPMVPATTTKPAFITQALTPRGAGTFLAREQLEPPRAAPASSGSGASSARGPHTPRSRPSTRETLPHLAASSQTRGVGWSSPRGKPHEGLTAPDPAVEGEQGPAPPAGTFASLSWSDKEKIIAALLFELNRAFYDGKVSAADARGLGGVEPVARPLPVQRDDDEEVAEWGTADEPSAIQDRHHHHSYSSHRASRNQHADSANAHSGDSGTPNAPIAAAFPCATPGGTGRGTSRPPQAPPTAPGGQRITHKPQGDSRPPTRDGAYSATAVPAPPPGPPLSALRKGSAGLAAGSARSSAGSSRRATFAPATSRALHENEAVAENGETPMKSLDPVVEY